MGGRWLVLAAVPLLAAACSSVPAPLASGGGPAAVLLPTPVADDADGSLEVLSTPRGGVRMVSGTSSTIVRLPGMPPGDGISLPGLRQARRIDAVEGRREARPVLLLSARTASCPGGGANVLVVPKGGTLVVQEMGRCGRPMRLARSEGAVLAVDDASLETWSVRGDEVSRIRAPLGEARGGEAAAPRVTRVEAPPLPPEFRSSIPDPGWAVRP